MIIYEPHKLDRTKAGKPHSAFTRRRRRFARPALPWRKLMTVLAIFGAATLVLFGCYVGWRAYSSMRAGDEQSSTASTQHVTATQSYLTDDDRTQNRPLGVSLDGPTSWHVKTDDGSKVTLMNKADVIVSHFAFRPEAPGGNADGDLVLENISGWLQTEDQLAAGGSLKPAQKLAYANFLAGLSQAGSVKTEDASSLVSLAGQVGGVHNLLYVESADKKLSGVIFETIISHEGRYQPVILAYMAGKVDDQPVYLRGVVTYQDPAYIDLYGDGATADTSRVQQAIKTFADGQIDDGMIKLAQHWRDMLKTLKIDSSKRQAGSTPLH